ncbi:MAG: hypothetical protein U1E76_26105 [Planctomycetota bacterium]
MRRNAMMRSRSRQRGVMAVAAMMIVVPLVLMTFAYISLEARNQMEEEQRSHQRTAEHLANSGIDRVLVELLTNPNFEQGSAGLATGGVSYGVVDRWDDGHSRFLRIRSLGFTDAATTPGGNWVPSVSSTSKALVAIARERTFDFDLRQAVFLGDPLVEMDVHGNSFLIQGADRKISDGSPGQDGQVPGINSVRDAQDVKDQLSDGQRDRVQGLGGSPSIYQRAGQDDLHLVDDLIDFYKSSASIRFSEDTNYSGSLGDPDQSQFVVTYATGDLHIGGDSKGAGMLLVDGDLEITGTFRYVGIVAVKGRVRFLGGSQSLDGTILIGEDVRIGGEQVNGSVTLQYSSEAVATAKSASGRYSVEAILQAP